MAANVDVTDHLNYYRLRTHRKARAHFLSSKKLSKRHVWLGIPIMIISTLAGSSVVADISESISFLTVNFIAFLSLFAAVLSSFQTFFAYAGLSEKHKSAGNQYSSLFRRLSLMKAKYASGEIDQAELFKLLEEIQLRWDAIEQEAADIPDSIYDKAKQEQLTDEEGI